MQAARSWEEQVRAASIKWMMQGATLPASSPSMAVHHLLHFTCRPRIPSPCTLSFPCLPTLYPLPSLDTPDGTAPVPEVPVHIKTATHAQQSDRVTKTDMQRLKRRPR